MNISRIDSIKMRDMYYNMLFIRTAEIKIATLYQKGEIPGFLHSYIGEEAVAAGVCAALKNNDFVMSTHRGHGHLIAKGGEIDKIMAELFGKATGYCKGKGGSMHIADVNLGILGANGIVGAGLPIANGAALTSIMKNTKQVVVCFFGDGASNQGTFHESLNLASIWKLPVIFVCENNLYAMSTSQKNHTNIENIAERSKAYGILGIITDGNDVLDVFQKTSEAVERARNGEGPTLMECKTYRHMGHYVGDPGVYRSKEEEAEWKEKDPIVSFRQLLINKQIMTCAELDEIEKKISDEVEEAVNYARLSPYPAPEEAMEHLYTSWKWGNEYK